MVSKLIKTDDEIKEHKRMKARQYRENRKQEYRDSVERMKKWDEEHKEERERLIMLDAAPRLKAKAERDLKYPTVLSPEYIKERQERKDKIKQQCKERQLKLKQSKLINSLIVDNNKNN